MPINIQDGLPAIEVLDSENIFVMTETKACQQDIRPLSIVILNLMPTKISTETQILRLLGNSPLQVDIVLIHPKTHKSKNTDEEHLVKFYNTFDEIKERKFDGLIITGAPVEQLKFEDVNYWNELADIMEWSSHNVFSTLHICWGAQAGLFYHYGIKKYPLPEKMFGIFDHYLLKNNVKLLRGFDDMFSVPQSRHTEVRRGDIEAIEEIELLSVSDESGVYIAASKDGRRIFVTGHSEYDRNTLKDEYFRDVSKGLEIEMPRNYFPQNDSSKEPETRWKGHANLLFSNWLNYYVYQETPYDLNQLR